MNPISQSERITQDRVLKLFRTELGYRYLDDWTHRESNSNIERAFRRPNGAFHAPLATSSPSAQSFAGTA